MRSLGCVMVMLVGAVSAGCAPWATYPPIETKSPLTSAELPPFPTLMAEAIWHVNYEYGAGTHDFAFNLPPGTTPLVYEKVRRRLGDGVGHPQADLAGPAVHVSSVRSRGTVGEVDVIFPRDDGLYEMVTVRLRNEIFRGWYVADDRRWRFPIEAPPPPSFTPSSPPEVVVEAGTEPAGE
ncbi:MAG: hypothetical protein ACYTJ0_06120 [Planctomycetota bacterium]|jgi:hypothetical protein